MSLQEEPSDYSSISLDELGVFMAVRTLAFGIGQIVLTYLYCFSFDGTKMTQKCLARPWVAAVIRGFQKRY